MPPRSAKRFQLYLIKPSHYDDDGYVIQWIRSAIPANSLAVLYGLARDCAERHVLGEETELDIFALDETNTRIRPQRIARAIARADGFGMVGLIGVQSNQFPRAMDIARPLREVGVQVCIGGFHVSGCIARLPDLPEDLREALRLGISLFAGRPKVASKWSCAMLRRNGCSQSTISWTNCRLSMVFRCRSCRRREYSALVDV
jgi:hypothetical protein